MFKLTRDSTGRLVVICEGCGATHLDAPHDRNTAWQRTHADEHRKRAATTRAEGPAHWETREAGTRALRRPTPVETPIPANREEPQT